MKVLAILGSPRVNGNSAKIAKKFLEKAEEKGASTRMIFLNKLTYRGCQACMACKGKMDKCVLNDELTPVLNDMHEAHIILYVSPVYYFELTGQFKLFMDRTFSHLTPQFMTGPDRCRLPKGKHLVFIITQGAGEEEHKDLQPKYSRLKDFYQFEDVHFIQGCNLYEPDAVLERKDLLEEAEKLAHKLVA